MSFPLISAKKSIAMMLDGKIPDEMLLRGAKAELAEASSGKPAAVVVTEASLPVSQEDAIRALGEMFMLMEATMIQMKQESQGKLILDSAVADVYIKAKQLLIKAHYEPLIHRKDPLKITPIRVP